MGAHSIQEKCTSRPTLAYELEQKVKFLKNGMSRAVTKEEFEKAAMLRDEIVRMESQTSNDQ